MVTDTTTEKKIYVDDWDHFIGQRLAVEQLKIACASAKRRFQPLDHVLIAGGKPGIGKTTLAHLIAKELGVRLFKVSGKVTVNEARIVINDMRDRDILFYDEIHQAVTGGRAQAEWMLPVLQDGVIMGPLGEEDIPKITIIGATTDAGKLQRPIVERFTIRPTLVDYSDEEGAKIAWLNSCPIFAEAGMHGVSTDLAARVARTSNNVPRDINQILRQVRDIAYVRDVKGNAYDDDFERALVFMHRTEDGLDYTMQRYLVSLLTEFGGSAGERAIQNRLQEPGGVAFQEAILLDKGLIAMTGRGRTLTASGIRRAKDLRAEGIAA